MHWTDRALEKNKKLLTCCAVLVISLGYSDNEFMTKKLFALTFLPLLALATEMPVNDRPGSWVVRFQEYRDQNRGAEACEGLAEMLRETSLVRYKFKGQNFARVGATHFCNFDLIEYHPTYEDYLPNLRWGDDFDANRADDFEYVQNYFRSAIEELRARFSPHPIEIRRHGSSTNTRTSYFRYRARFPETFIPTLVEDKIFTAESVNDQAGSVEEAMVRRDFLESILVKLYPENSLQILDRGIDRQRHSNGSGFYWGYRGWIQYHADFANRQNH